MRSFLFTLALCAAWFFAAARAARGEGFDLPPNSVTAFVGGANAVAMQESGHLETLLTLAFADRSLRFVHLAWEADTVYSQPRDLNFPPLASELRRFQAGTVFLLFGQAESLQGPSALPGFTAAYENMLGQFSLITPRLVLVTPAPFEAAAAPLPDLSRRNADLKLYAGAIREMAARRNLPCVDLFTALAGKTNLTSNGMHWTPWGRAEIAQAAVKQLGLDARVPTPGSADKTGAWPNPEVERMREAIAAKNRLWFNYWRPTNWAFLAGDRTEQPSSHDHRDYKIRWFPAEMQQYAPLIEKAESNIRNLSRSAALK